jgi:hypothetical protein
MTISTLLQRTNTPLAGLTLALLASLVLPGEAKAVGFINSFAPANWSIVNTTNGVVDETLSSATYTCFSGGNDVACVENLSELSGAVDVVGSLTGFTGGGSAGTLRTTTWTVTNGSTAALLSFDWALSTYGAGATNQTVSYLVGSSVTNISSANATFGNFSSIPLAAGESFGFRVATTDNTGENGILSISNFTAANSTPTPVPGPLPLAGVIPFLAWSRRLRSRIRRSKP